MALAMRYNSSARNFADAVCDNSFNRALLMPARRATIDLFTERFAKISPNAVMISVWSPKYTICSEIPNKNLYLKTSCQKSLSILHRIKKGRKTKKRGKNQQICVLDTAKPLFRHSLPDGERQRHRRPMPTGKALRGLTWPVSNHRPIPRASFQQRRDFVRLPSDKTTVCILFLNKYLDNRKLIDTFVSIYYTIMHLWNRK